MVVPGSAFLPSPAGGSDNTELEISGSLAATDPGLAPAAGGVPPFVAGVAATAGATAGAAPEPTLVVCDMRIFPDE